jgi:hypothetical protein
MPAMPILGKSKLRTTPHRIRISLTDINQLFNSMDPSPFNEKDLDQDAEEYIFTWAQEYSQNEPISLAIHLKQLPDGEDPKPMIQTAVRNYFAYKARLNRLEFSRLMKQGRDSLVVGLLFLSSCLLISQVLIPKSPGTLLNLARESLSIAGWVAMWRPMEIYLYDWWPLRRRGRTYEKLSKIDVELRKKD